MRFWLLLIGGLAWAQPTGPVFEVASIRVHDGPLYRIDITTSGARLRVDAQTVRGMIMWAYDLRNDQVAMPDKNAVGDTFYEISAKAEGDGEPSKDQFKKMLQALLADRFNVKLHREMRETPVYHLVVDRGGPKFGESAAGATHSGRMGVTGRNQTVDLKVASIDDFVHQLGVFVDRPVIDQTGLTKKYDFKFEATPAFRLNRDPDVSDLTAYTAVRAQLGLRLEPAKDMVEVVVVDRVEKPTEN